MSRSTTVGTPSVRIPPVGLGISTRRTARGRYRPSSSACLTLGQCTLSQPLNSATVSSSTPGAPPPSRPPSRELLLLRSASRSSVLLSVSLFGPSAFATYYGLG